MKHIIVVNPVSGRKKGVKYAVAIQTLLKKNNIHSSIFISKYSGHILHEITELVAKDTYRFYCVGGDGTLNELVSSVVYTDSEIVVIPGGTGNDFNKSISKYTSMRKIINTSISKESTKTDVIKIGKNSYCINILNMGFDALIAKNVDKFRNIPLISGKLKYNLSIFYSMFPNRSYIFKIRTKDKILKGKFTLLAIGNGKYYGGGICPCPDADLFDGKLNICAIDSTTTLQKISLLPKYKKGKHTSLKQANIFDSEEVSIVSNKKFPVSIDGEISYTNKIKATILKNSINIVKID